MQIIPLSNQTLLDAAIQTGADATRLVEMALQLGVSITDDVQPGAALAGLTPASGLKKLAQQLAAIKPASGITGLTGSYTQPPLQSWVAFVPNSNNLVKVYALQTVLDIAAECAGSVEEVLSYAALLGMALTDDLTPGSSITKPAVINPQMVKRLAGLYPATGISNTEAELLEGIGYWAIGLDFIVS